MLVPFAAALLLGTVLAWWLGTSLLSHSLESRVSEQLHHAVDVVSKRSFPAAGPVLARLNKLLRASIYFIDTDGRLLLYGSEPPSVALQDVLRSHYLQWQQKAGIEPELRFSAQGRDFLLVMRAPDAEPGSRQNAVIAFSDLSDVRSATRLGGLWLAALAFCGITLLALIGYRVARSITVPVGELASMAGDIAAGQRSVRVDVRREDEIGALAKSLNSMAERLAGYEKQMVEQSRLATLGELSAKLAHEIRNPLTAIKMQLQLLEDEVAPPARQRLAGLMDEVSRLELVVAGTLQLGRPDPLQRQSVQLNDIVDEVVRLLEPQFQHRQIEIRGEFADGLPPCLVDIARVKQILLNLLNNAADELPDGGIIEVSSALAPNDCVLLQVADSGGGVPRDQRDGLFERSGSDKATGFGLGLRVTRELVQLHGGSIEVGSSTLGGASFRVVLPLEN